QPSLDLFFNIVRITAEYPVAHQRILLLKLRHQVSKDTGRLILAASNRNLPGNLTVSVQEVIYRLLCKFCDLLSPPLQKQTVIRKIYMMAAPLQQFHPQLLFQLNKLPRERWLRNMKDLRRYRYVLFPCSCQETFKNQ